MNFLGLEDPMLMFLSWALFFSIAAILVTLVVIKVAIYFNFLSAPKKNRWSKRSIPLGGGAALYLVSIVPVSLVSPDVALGATIIFILGFVDDIFHIKAETKLLFQTLAAVIAVAAPFEGKDHFLSITHISPIWDIPFTIILFVVLSNSTNLLDNMDGSASGVTLIISGYIFVLAVMNGNMEVAFACVALLSANLGFLVFNFPPAKIFMGDSGSLLLGYLVVGLYASLTPITSSGFYDAFSLLLLAGTPLFDTCIVWFSRKAVQRPFLLGGSDHISHRLVRLGLSERRSLLTIYGFTFILGAIAIGMFLLKQDYFTILLLVVAGSLVTVLGIFLGEIPVYERHLYLNRQNKVRISTAFSKILELTVYIGIICAAWSISWLLRFETELTRDMFNRMALQNIPVVIIVSVLAIGIAGLMGKGLGDNITFEDGRRILLASVMSAFSIFALMEMVSVFEVYSRGVVAIYGFLLLIGLTGIRSLSRVIRSYFMEMANHPTNVVLFANSSLVDYFKSETNLLTKYQVIEVIDPDSLSVEEIEKKIMNVKADIALITSKKTIDTPIYKQLSDAGFSLRTLKVTIC